MHDSCARSASASAGCWRRRRGSRRRAPGIERRAPSRLRFSGRGSGRDDRRPAARGIPRGRSRRSPTSSSFAAPLNQFREHFACANHAAKKGVPEVSCAFLAASSGRDARTTGLLMHSVRGFSAIYPDRARPAYPQKEIRQAWSDPASGGCAPRFASSDSAGPGKMENRSC